MGDIPLLTWKGRRVRSPGDDPQATAKKVPDAPLRPGSLFFVPSPLEGWGVDVLLDRLSADSAVVLLEKDSALEAHCHQALRHHLGHRMNDPRLFWLEIDTEAAVRELFLRLPLNTLRRVEWLTFNGAWMSHSTRYREVFTRLEEGLTRWWSNRMTCLHMGPLWLKNLFDNLSRPSCEWSPWPDWSDDTVLVCGAGISLESALPYASQHRSRLRIIAADTALPVLKSWDLVPDAVVCLEAQHANLRDFAGWKGANVRLFTDLTSYPPSARVFGPPPCWFVTEFTELDLWNRWPWPEIPRLPPLGSVGVAAAWVAWKLTRGSVILAGLDFSFPAGKTHSRGAPSLASLGARTNRLLPMVQTNTWIRPGLRNTKTGWLTTPVMEGYAAVLKDQATPHAHRTWTWDSLGLPLDLPVWNRQTPSPLGKQIIEVPPETGPDRQTWLALEAVRWQRLLEALDQWERGQSEADWQNLLAQLKALDYLTFCFPDPQPRPDADWLIRAQVQLKWLIDRVSRPRRS